MHVENCHLTFLRYGFLFAVDGNVPQRHHHIALPGNACGIVLSAILSVMGVLMPLEHCVISTCWVSLTPVVVSFPTLSAQHAPLSSRHMLLRKMTVGGSRKQICW